MVKRREVISYYNGNIKCKYGFIIGSWNLFEGSGIESYKSDKDIRSELMNNLDEFNFSKIIRLAIAIELSVKGILIHKGVDILNFDKKTKKFKTKSFNSLLKLYKKISDKIMYKKFIGTFQFFQQKRNEFIHSARIEYIYKYKVLLKHFKLVREYFNEFIKPLKEELSEKIANNSTGCCV